MINTKAAFIISMFDEYKIVIKTILTINKNYKEPLIIVIRSDDGKKKEEWKQIQMLSTKSKTLSNLATKFNRFALPAHALARNFSTGFSLIDEDVDYIVVLLGDTLISNPKPLHKKVIKMINQKAHLCCCKAYGQYFHSKESTPKKIVAERYQDPDTTDFSAVLFVVNGLTFQETKCFTNIKVTNQYSSEQCLGDEMLKYYSKKEVLDNTILLNEDNKTFCYSFTDGITYHAVTGKPGR